MYIGGKLFQYALAVELPEKFLEFRVLVERLTIDGQPVYSRNHAEVTLAKATTPFMVDWHLVALPVVPVVQVRGTENPIAIFKDWLSKMVIISPAPGLMNGVSDEESLEPAYDCGNFASWFGGGLGQYHDTIRPGDLRSVFEATRLSLAALPGSFQKAVHPWIVEFLGSPPHCPQNHKPQGMAKKCPARYCLAPVGSGISVE